MAANVLHCRERDFENPIPGGDADLQYDYKIIENFYRTRRATNQSR